jgi:hypothetical protein
MQCEIRFDPLCARRWIAILVGELRRRRLCVRLRSVSVSDGAIPSTVRCVEAIESRLYRSSRPLGAMLASDEIARLAAEYPQSIPADLIVDLSGHNAEADHPGAQVLLPLAEGMALEAGIAAALLERRPPRLTIILQTSEGARVVSEGVPAVPDASVYLRGYETVAARVVTLLVQAIEHVAGKRPPIGPAKVPHTAKRPGVVDGLAFVAEAVAEKIRLKWKRRRAEPDRWTVGWREVQGDAVIERLAWPTGGYQWLPDDGLRYYADPFVFAHKGRRYLFVEEYVYATCRGHLSVADWLGDGWSIPRPILEREYHLSWPRVFAHEGEIYMLPETSEARTLELYRAIDFPDKWEIASVLATDLSLADATTLTRDGETWMLAAITDGVGTSSWDGLAILRGEGPTQPMRLVSDGACLVDVRAARPAGDIVRVGNEWRRPVQDCALGYGSALGIARIDELSAEGYRQTMLKRLPPDPAWGAIGVHTLNVADGIEVIDINRGFDIRRGNVAD